MDEVWEKPAEVAKELRVAVDKVLGLISTGELAAINIAQRTGGKPRWRISAAAKAAFLASRCNQPAPAPSPKPSRRRRDESVTRYF